MSELVDVWFTFWNALMWSVAVAIRISLWARRENAARPVGTGRKGRGGEGRERKMGIEDREGREMGGRSGEEGGRGGEREGRGRKRDG